METIFKTFRAEVKDVNENEGTVDMFIPVSTDSVDRDGEIVEPTAFKKTLPKFMKRPVLVASHDYRELTSQIGEWSKLKIEETGLNGKPKYYVNAGNEQADWGFYLASRGMAAFSIGFIPKVWEDGDGVKEPRRTYKEVELLEISQVIVPSNREAIQSIRSKSADPIVKEICDEVEKNIPKEGIQIPNLVTKPEETDEYIRIPVSEGHGEHRIRTITISDKEGIKALYCGECKKVITYLFAKDHGWTMGKARAWVKEHEKKSLEVEHEISQAEIIDEIDYLKSLIEKEGLSEVGKQSAMELIFCIAKPYKWEIRVIDTELIKRISGCDKPVKYIGNGDDLSRPQNGDDLPQPLSGTLTNQDILESLKRIGGIKC